MIGSDHAGCWEALTAERSQVQPTFTSIEVSFYPLGLRTLSTVDSSLNTLAKEQPLCTWHPLTILSLLGTLSGRYGVCLHRFSICS